MKNLRLLPVLSHLVRYIEAVLYIQAVAAVLLTVMNICHTQS
jgi:hypothetical protein